MSGATKKILQESRSSFLKSLRTSCTANNRYDREHIGEIHARTTGKDEIRMLLFRDVSSVLTRSTPRSIGAKAVENGGLDTEFKGINERHSVAVVNGDGDTRSRHNHNKSDSTCDEPCNNVCTRSDDTSQCDARTARGSRGTSACQNKISIET